MNITYAFLYKWTEISTSKWYVGSRTKANCHPSDGYLCSSRTVAPLIRTNPTNWTRQILCIGNATDMLQLETDYLVLVDAKHDPMSYNRHNGDGKFSTVGIAPWNKGLKQPTGKPAWNQGLTKENNASIAQASAKLVGRDAHNKGKAMSEEFCAKMKQLHNNRSPETCKKISESLVGRKHTEESNAKRSATLVGRIQDNVHIMKRANARRGKKNPNVSPMKGMPKIKTVTRIFDRKEMSAGHYTTWNNSQNKRTN